MTALQSLGRQIAEVRKGNRLTQAALADLSGLSRATIDALENGRSSDIGVSRLTRILAVLGLELVVRPIAGQRPTLEDLMEDSDD